MPDGAILNDPVIPAARRDHAALRDRECVGGVLEGNPFHADVAQTARPRSKHLLLDRQLNLVLGRVCIAGKSRVDRQPVVLAPEGAVLPAELLVELDLLQPPPIHEHHAAVQQMLP